jgi:hypothetical protein
MQSDIDTYRRKRHRNYTLSWFEAFPALEGNYEGSVVLKNEPIKVDLNGNGFR